MDKPTKSLVLFPQNGLTQRSISQQKWVTGRALRSYRQNFFGRSEMEEVPKFFVYGEPARPVDIGFLHVETVMARHNIHSGHVAAHLHPQMGQITFWTSGNGTYRIEDNSWDFAAPTVSFVPSNVVHGFDIAPGSDAIVASISDDALRALSVRTKVPTDHPIFVMDRGNDAVWSRLGSTMNQIATEHAERLPGSDPILEALIAIALCNIARLHSTTSAVNLPAVAMLVSRFQGLVDQQFREDRRVGDYVRALGTTPHLLDQAVRKVLGGTVKDVIIERRMLEAKRLLLFTVRSVEDIGFEIGFKDAAYFSRFFRHRVGQPPSAWRQEHLAARP
ncbi:MAG: helix-turn-helix domain-containing protein [Devosia sp.]